MDKTKGKAFKKQRANYKTDEDALKRMAAAVLEAHQTPPPINLAQIARTHEVPWSSLKARLEGRPLKSTAGFPKLLTDDDERILAHFLELMVDGGVGLNQHKLRLFVNTFLRENNKEQEVSQSWVSRFIQKNTTLSNRMTQNLSRLRLKAMSCTKLNDFYDLIEGVVNKYGVISEAIFNCDEGGFCCNPKVGSVIARRGSKKVYQIVPNDGNKYVTVHFCGNAFGKFIKPLILFKGKQLKTEWATDPQSFYYNVAPNGWMIAPVFLDWMEKCFIKSAREMLPEEYCGPLVLIMDGHSTHVQYKVVEFASKNNIVLIKLPAHSTHLLQPLDVGYFGPLKSSWFTALDAWNTNYNSVFTEQYFSQVLKYAISITNCDNLCSGFRASGIIPLDKSAISNNDMAVGYPWDVSGWQWFGTPSVVERLEAIDILPETSVMEHCVLDYVIDTLKPKERPAITTTITPVISQDLRMKRGCPYEPF